MSTALRRLPGWLLFTLQVLFVAAAPVVAALLVPRSKWWLAAAAGAAAIGLIAGEARRSREQLRTQDQERSEEEARTESRVAMVAALKPIADTLSAIVSSGKRERQELLGIVTQAIVVAAVRQVPAADVRGGWYAHRREPDGQRVLARTCSDGRNDTTEQTQFVEGTEEGDVALAMVDQEGVLHVPDLAADPPRGWDPDRVRRYGTFVSVGVSAKGQPLGMLTVDAVQAGSLTDEDVQTVILLASMLRVALAADLT